MLDLEQWHTQSLVAIEQCLDLILAPNLNYPSELLASIRYSTLDGGKRIRPLFCLASAELNQAQAENALLVGCAIEMIHCFSLIHDDLPIMDNDDLRRGKPTNHKVFGDAVALLAGDALQALCFELLSSIKLTIPSNNKLQIINLVASSIGLLGMVGGQTIDWLSTGHKLDLAQLQKMHQLKTGALLKASILAGYLTGNTYDQQQYQLLSEIADNIGLLFQIVDDIIDVTQDTQTLGKTANKDLLQDKATYVNILGLEVAKHSAEQLYLNTINKIEQLDNNQQLSFLTAKVYYRNS